VLVREEHAIPGADRFIKALQAAELPFLVLTNNSIYTPRDLSARLAGSGIELPPDRIWTSALAAAADARDRAEDDGGCGGEAVVECGTRTSDAEERESGRGAVQPLV
jgi:ribonucleotide monophosphatase NagD (HAD superfamily)